VRATRVRDDPSEDFDLLATLGEQSRSVQPRSCRDVEIHEPHTCKGETRLGVRVEYEVLRIEHRSDPTRTMRWRSTDRTFEVSGVVDGANLSASRDIL